MAHRSYDSSFDGCRFCNSSYLRLRLTDRLIEDTAVEVQ
jgi:hypothetical protein